MYTGKQRENTKASPTQAKSVCKCVLKEVYRLFISFLLLLDLKKAVTHTLLPGVCEHLNPAKQNRLCSDC